MVFITFLQRFLLGFFCLFGPLDNESQNVGTGRKWEIHRASSLFSYLRESECQRKEMTWASVILVDPGPELRFFSAEFPRV